MGTVIVDQYDDLFVPFHSLMTKALASVWDAYSPEHASPSCNNSNIEVWMGCSFTGDKMYAVVLQKLSSYISNVCNYAQYIYQIPQMSTLF